MRKSDSGLTRDGLKEFLTKSGYTLVPIVKKHYWTQDEPYDGETYLIPIRKLGVVKSWCTEQFTMKHFAEIPGHFVFTKENDATLFTLTWM